MIIVKEAHLADFTVTSGAQGGFEIMGQWQGTDVRINVQHPNQARRFLQRTEGLCGTIRVFDMTEKESFHNTILAA